MAISNEASSWYPLVGRWHVTLTICHLYYVGLGDRVAPATAGNIWSSELSEDFFYLKSRLDLLGLKRFILIYT